MSLLHLVLLEEIERELRTVPPDLIHELLERFHPEIVNTGN
jgi:hypothetical protein